MSHFYRRLSKNGRNLGHFPFFRKNFKLFEYGHVHIILKDVIWRFGIYYLFCDFMNNDRIVEKIINAFVKLPKLNMLKSNYVFEIFRSVASKWYMGMFTVENLERGSTIFCANLRKVLVQRPKPIFDEFNPNLYGVF